MDKLLEIKNKVLGFFKSEWKDIFKPITVLLVICITISLALSVTNSVTIDRISALEEEKKAETMELLVKADEYKEENLLFVKEAVSPQKIGCMCVYETLQFHENLVPYIVDLPILTTNKNGIRSRKIRICFRWN